ncbi:MAG: Holliday junction branch migration protein RuvA [Dehalococcoidia bacterium]|nr:Holliday junction branch migration protein RuvA [Dehalococcoidia bacterium]
MIDFVHGTLERVGPDFAVVRVGGVGLRVHVPAGTLASLPAPGGTVRLHTHLYVREEVLALYGFAETAELSLFELLLTVSGVGPRLALAILSTAPPERLAQEIANGDDTILLRVPGVGPRTAARLILELKNKVEAVPLPGGPDDGELLEALASLGYSAVEAQMAVRALPRDDSLSLEDQLRLALSQLAPQGD